MTNEKMLHDAADALRQVAVYLNELADNMTKEATSDDAPPVESTPEQPKVTLEQVRAVLAEKSHAGHTAEVRELLVKFGAKKLSEIDPSNYAALLVLAEDVK